MPTVSKIDWISTSSEEAEVTVRAGDMVCAAFCHPCRYREGDEIAQPLHIFGLKSAMRSDALPAFVEKVAPPGLGQRGLGRLVDLDRGEISIGDLQLVFDDRLPGDLAPGDMIEFDCARIDLW